jgi:hypothetical protein
MILEQQYFRKNKTFPALNTIASERSNCIIMCSVAIEVKTVLLLLFDCLLGKIRDLEYPEVKCAQDFVYKFVACKWLFMA